MPTKNLKQKKEIYYVTGNEGKFEEVKNFIQRHQPSICLKQCDIDLIEQQTTDQKSIAMSKAKQGWEKIGKPLLVDDSGIYFEKYKNFPGTMTKFLFEGIGFDGILKLVEGNNRACFLLHMVYVDGPNSFKIFEGRCDGQVITPPDLLAHPRLPYDDIFLPDGSDKTCSQMRGTEEMDEYAYRLRAMKKFLDWWGSKTALK